jgi:hypothetical protein
MLLAFLLMILVLSITGAGLGWRQMGLAGASPAAVVLVVLVVLLLSGNLPVRW